MAKTIAAYGGGFKPPTEGHFKIVKNALQEFPEIDEFIIYVGSKERDGIDQAEAILIWEIYENYLPNKVQIKAAQSPIGDILRLAKDNPQDEIYFVIGYRDGRDDDMKDVAARTSNLEDKYPNIEVKVMPTFDPNMSGTNARKAISDEEEFIKFLPAEVQEKTQIWNIVRPAVEESITENATYSQNIDYMQMISDLTNYMIEKGRNIEPLPELVIKNGETENAKNFFGRTAYYDPNTQTIVLYTEGRHPKDIVRSYAHEMVHHTQYLEDRLPNVQTTDTTASKELDAIEREAYLEGNMIFRNWTDSIDGDVSSSITEGKYDSLVTKLAGFTLNAWKGDFEDGQNSGKFELMVGPGEDFDYPHLKFKYIAKAIFWDAYRSRGIARPMKDLPEVELDYWIDVEELPEKWSEISMDLRNVIRHEIEHLMQSGLNVKKGKEMEPDRAERDEINKISKKPWWKIWRKALGSPDYYKLEKEIDANLQGLYLQAKKSRQPLEDIIDDYLKNELKLSVRDQKDIKALWKERAPRLNIPLEENLNEFSMSPDVKKIVDKVYGTAKEAGKKLLDVLKRETKQTIYAIKEISEWVIKQEKPSPAEQKKIVEQLKDFGYLGVLYVSNYKLIFSVLYYIIDQSDIVDQFLELNEGRKPKKDPKKGTGKKPEGSKRRLYTDEDPKDTIGIKFSTRQDIVDTLNKNSFKAKSHARQSQIINLIHQRVRAAYGRAKDPAVKKRLKTGLDYITKKKEASKAKTQRLKKEEKDYFGLNKLIREIVEEPKYKIFSDMDGVLTDFEGRFEKYSDGLPPRDYEKKFGKDKFWELVDGEGVAFWVGMPWMSDGERYWDYIKDYDTQLLSSPSRSNTSRLGKRLWVRNNMPGVKLTLAQAYLKKNYAAPNHILIDDRKSNIDEWRAEGGIGILHTSAADTIQQLKKLGI